MSYDNPLIITESTFTHLNMNNERKDVKKNKEQKLKHLVKFQIQVTFFHFFSRRKGKQNQLNIDIHCPYLK